MNPVLVSTALAAMACLAVARWRLRGGAFRPGSDCLRQAAPAVACAVRGNRGGEGVDEGCVVWTGGGLQRNGDPLQSLLELKVRWVCSRG